MLAHVLFTDRRPSCFFIRLNEGFTVFVERKIIGRMKGQEHSEFSAILGHNALQESIKHYGSDHRFTALCPCLRGEDPDDAFSKVPYGKLSCTSVLADTTEATFFCNSVTDDPTYISRCI